MYRGERLLNEGRYSEALPYLQETLRVAPGSDKGTLLTAKAALLAGDVQAAHEALKGHDDGRFEDGDDSNVQEVKSLWNRAIAALDKADEASKLAEKEGQGVEAARLMHQALSMYPESSGLAEATEYYDEGAAFDSKDYDGFLSITQRHWKKSPGAETASSFSSALACKYAVTGDASYRRQSEELLAQAEQLAQADPEQLKSFHKYSERIRYRLEKREIITVQEYNRRFRPGQAEPK